MATAEASEAAPLWLQSDHEDNTYRILLVGKTGSGKSRTGNTLLGVKRFKTKLGMASETYECQLEQIHNASYTMEVMDCPGLFDTKTPNTVILDQILKAVGSMHPGPTAILYTIKIGDRYTEEEYLTFKLLKKAFGREIVNYMIIGFTHGDKLAMEDMTIDEYVNDAIKEAQKFKKVYEQCGERYVEFNNTPGGPKGQQVEIFLTKINEMVKPYKHRTFRCDKFQIIDIEFEAEVRRRLQEGKKGLRKKGREKNRSKVENELEQSQSESNERAEAEPKESAESVPLTDANTSEQDGNEPARDILLDFDEETIQRTRFELRQEIAQGGGFFQSLKRSILHVGVVSSATIAGMSLGSFAGPVGALVGTAVGFAIGHVFVTTAYILRRRAILREHMSRMKELWEEKLNAIKKKRSV